MVLCECGCGREVNPGRRFIHGHNRRGSKHSPESSIKMSKSASKRWLDQDNRNIQSKKMIEYYRYPKNRDAASERTARYFEDQDARDLASKRMIEKWLDPEYRDSQSKRIINSDEYKLIHEINIENMKGGNDILKHHHIYDHNDLSKYTIEITRSEHGRLHRNMKFLGIKVPHINTGYENEDELQLMEHIKKLE